MGGTDTITGLCISSDLFQFSCFSSSGSQSHNIDMFRDDAVYLSQPGELMTKAVTPVVHSEI